LVPKVKAGEIIKQIAPIVGGSGGGRPDFAQAGGRDPARLNEALDKVSSLLGGG
jgi:alanyl-tRNA synthetase